MGYLDTLDPRRRARVLQLGGAAAAAPRRGAAAAATAGLAAAGAPPAQLLSPAEVSRLRVRERSLAEENASLRSNLQALLARTKALDRELQAQRHASQQREQRAAERHAAAAAQQEEQLQRQRRALLDLAAAAESLARENAEQHARLVALQDENAAGSRSRALQQERLAGLQSVCLQLDQQAAGGSISIDGGGTGSGGGGQHAELLQQLTSTLRALGPANGATAAGAGKLPPAVAAGKAEAAARGLPTDLRLALREVEALRRQRQGLEGRLRAAEAQAARLHAERQELQQSLARERHAAAAATAELQRQLKAARERVEGMARSCGEKDGALEQRDRYVAQLERRLLQRGQPAAGRRRSSGGGGGNGSGAGCTSAAAASRLVAEALSAGCGGRVPACEQVMPEAGCAPRSQHAAATATLSPSLLSLAALSPEPGSSGTDWQRRQQAGHANRREQQQQQQQPGLPAGLDGCQQGEAEECSPGADSTIPADSPRRDLLPPRRLRWALDLSSQLEQQEQQEEEEGDAEEEAWCDYRLGSPPEESPMPGRHRGSGFGGMSGRQQHCSQCDAGISSNPLFSFRPQPAAAGSEPAPAAFLAAGGCGGGGHTSSFHNELFCAAPHGGAPPLHPASQRGAATVSEGEGAEEQQLPARMPSGEFPSVSALLEALTPGSQPAAAGPLQEQAAAGAGGQMGSAAVPGRTAEPQPLATAACQPDAGSRPDSGATDAAVERRLQEAVACFFATSALKQAPGQRQQQEDSGARRHQSHGMQVPSSSGAACKQRQHQQQGGSPAAGRGKPALRNGRINRAADQHQQGQQAGGGPAGRW